MSVPLRVSPRNRAAKHESGSEIQSVKSNPSAASNQNHEVTNKLKSNGQQESPKKENSPENADNKPAVDTTNIKKDLRLSTRSTPLQNRLRDKIKSLISDETEEIGPRVQYHWKLQQLKNDPNELQKLLPETILVLPQMHQDNEPAANKKFKVERTNSNNIVQPAIRTSSRIKQKSSKVRFSEEDDIKASTKQIIQSQTEKPAKRLKIARDTIKGYSSDEVASSQSKSSSSSRSSRSTRSPDSRSSQASSTGDSIRPREKILRRKTGCWTCRLRRKRCPEQRPICGECIRLGIECFGYGPVKPAFMLDKELMKVKVEQMKAITNIKRRDSREWKNTKKLSRLSASDSPPESKK